MQSAEKWRSVTEVLPKSNGIVTSRKSRCNEVGVVFISAGLRPMGHFPPPDPIGRVGIFRQIHPVTHHLYTDVQTLECRIVLRCSPTCSGIALAFNRC